MSRKIKFRAWNNTQMEYSDSLEKFFAMFDNDYDKSPVMQFTGLFDKNGVEIYEGDIIRIRTASRSEQTHYGDNIPNGEYCEPLEPEIITETHVVQHKNGMFTISEDEERPLIWDMVTYKNEEELMQGFEGHWSIYTRRGHEQDWEDDLLYVLEEYKLKDVGELFSYLGVEIIGNIHQNANLLV